MTQMRQKQTFFRSGLSPTLTGLLLVSVLLVAAGAHTQAGGNAVATFMVRLRLTHGHLRECWFGVDPHATSGFDRRLDEMAPPPGIETGYTAFISPDGRLFLYKDVRAPGPHIVWKFMARVFPGKPIHIQWDPKKLPDAWRFTLKTNDAALDMKTHAEVTVTDTCILRIDVERREQLEKTSDQ